eukprot:g22284.t1
MTCSRRTECSDLEFFSTTEPCDDRCLNVHEEERGTNYEDMKSNFLTQIPTLVSPNILATMSPLHRHL